MALWLRGRWKTTLKCYVKGEHVCGGEGRGVGEGHVWEGREVCRRGHVCVDSFISSCRSINVIYC